MDYQKSDVQYTEDFKKYLDGKCFDCRYSQCCVDGTITRNNKRSVCYYYVAWEIASKNLNTRHNDSTAPTSHD